MANSFKNASDAFEYYYGWISTQGVDRAGTKCIFNEGFYIEDPSKRIITTKWRQFSEEYAHNEWLWYETGDPHITKLEEINGSVPPVWQNHVDENGAVRSNYGHIIKEGNQWPYIVEELKRDPLSRRAVISLYNGSDNHRYKYDTPCTQTLGFTIEDGKLNMTATMRSNDLWFGFGNDQYCFSMYQEKLANELGVEMGYYFHFNTNFHIYDNFLNRNK